MYIHTVLLLTFITHSATIKYFKTLELIHFQIKIPKRGQAKAKEGRMLSPAPPERNPVHVCKKTRTKSWHVLNLAVSIKKIIHHYLAILHMIGSYTCFCYLELLLLKLI